MNMNEKLYDTIIIGGGPAGLTAAIYLLREEKKVLLIEKSAIGGQIINTERLENYPGFHKITGTQLMDRMFDQVDFLGLEIEYDEAINCNKNEKENYFIIETKHGLIFKTKTILLATGLSYRKFGFKNEDNLIGKGISYCPTCDGPFFTGKDVNLIGDGPAAMQYANILSSYANHVYMYTLTENLFGEKLVIDSINNNPKITQIKNASLQDFIGEEHLEGLKFIINDEEKIINTDNVFVAIGKVPNRLISQEIENVNGYITVSENMETSVPGIYAAGDIIDKNVKQVITACGDGAVAAVSISNYLRGW